MVGGVAKKPHHKVRTGCTTCKKRRVKCDETKPSCRKCTESLRKCDGYDPPRMWLFESAQSAKEHQRVPLKTPAAFNQLESPAEQRAFQFFIERTAPILSAYFGRSFWSVTVPQVTFVQPAIKYIVVSISTVTEFFDFKRDEPTNDNVFQSNYTKAVRSLTNRGRSQPTETLLMACLLFACLDFIRGEMPSGMRHVQAGLNIIDEWYRTKFKLQGDKTPEAQVVLAVAPLFRPYLEKAKTYGVCDELQFESLSLLQSSFELTYIPKAFSCVQEARHAADGLSHHLVTVLESPDRDTDTTSLAFEVSHLLRAYRVALDTFNVRCRPYTRARFGRILKLLQVQHKVMEMLLDAWSLDTCDFYSSHLAEFQFIVDHYDELKGYWEGEHPEMMFAPSRSLVFHLGYIPPLFFVAVKCPDPQIRELALQHLQWLHVHESNWTSCVAHHVAKTIATVNARATSLRCCAREVSEQYPVYINQVTYVANKFAEVHFSCAKCRGGAKSFETELLGLSELECVSAVNWPLERIVRVGGYQGGVAPLPSGCNCFTPATGPSIKRDIMLQIGVEPDNAKSTSLQADCLDDEENRTRRHGYWLDKLERDRGSWDISRTDYT